VVVAGHSSNTIPRIEPPSRSTFYRDYVEQRRPVIVTGLVERWPATRLWSPSYLRDAYGSVKVTVARTDADGSLVMDLENGLNYGETTVAAYVEEMQEAANCGHYMVAELRRFPERFRRELLVPEYCRGALWRRSKLWFGSKGTRTQMHRGAPENLYSVVRGRKRFVMYPPAQTRLLYPYSIFSKLPNFSPVNPDQPDYRRFPRFRDARPWIADLVDGDTLFIPTLWWHHVVTLESTMAVNFWWSRGLSVLVSAATHVYKKVRGLST
jgi:hypothetical protein